MGELTISYFRERSVTQELIDFHHNRKIGQQYLFFENVVVAKIFQVNINEAVT